jgi:hypothetical protein
MLKRAGLLCSAGRGVAMVAIAVLVLTVAKPPTAAASSARPLSTGLSATTPSSTATDFSARRRHRHYYRNNAAGLAIMGGLIGTIAGTIAAERRRDEYYDYYGRPGYYGYGPGYYAPAPYYGRRYYRYYPY